MIDASVGLLPEHTWIVKGMSHVEFAYDHETSDLGVWMVTSEKPVDIHTDARYPQFTELDRKTGKLVSLTANVTVPTDETPADQTFFQKIEAFFQSLLARLQGLLR